MNSDAAARPLRLVPEMASLRLQVLAFTRAYIAHWGEGPSYGEIAQATATNRMSVKKVVQRLIVQGMLLRAPGARGLMLPDRRDDALRVLRELGWSVDASAARLVPPITNCPLQAPDALDYDGRDWVVGRCTDDGAQEIEGTDTSSAA